MIEDTDIKKEKKLILSGQDYEKYKTAIVHFLSQSDKSKPYSTHNLITL